VFKSVCSVPQLLLTIYTHIISILLDSRFEMGNSRSNPSSCAQPDIQEAAAN